MQGLEELFEVPVIESYGMTEAAHQMASNPLPPGQRKVGSVGLAAGPEVSIMDQAGSLLPTSDIGEIVIRGANVMQVMTTTAMPTTMHSHGGGLGQATRGISTKMVICSSRAVLKKS